MFSVSVRHSSDNVDYSIIQILLNAFVLLCSQGLPTFSQSTQARSVGTFKQHHGESRHKTIGLIDIVDPIDVRSVSRQGCAVSHGTCQSVQRGIGCTANRQQRINPTFQRIPADTNMQILFIRTKLKHGAQHRNTEWLAFGTSVNDVSCLFTVETAIRWGLMVVTSDNTDATSPIDMPKRIATEAAASAFMTLC